MSLIKDTYEEVSEYLGNKIYKEVRELLEKAKKYNEEQRLFEKTMNNSSITTISEITYCRECVHRPHKEYSEVMAPKTKDGYIDYTCPYVCADSYYTRVPEDEFYCKAGDAHG